MSVYVEREKELNYLRRRRRKQDGGAWGRRGRKSLLRSCLSAAGDCY